MKLSKFGLATVAAALLLSLTIQAKNEMRKTYIFGFASSFNDSIVYFTDIQEIDSAWVTSKNKFLISRENYSYQLRDYLSGQGLENRTCMVEYSDDPKKLEKSWNKLYNKYAHNQKQKNNQKQTNQLPPFQIKKIEKGDFAFLAVTPQEEYIEETQEPAKKEKAKKASKAKKVAKKMKVSPNKEAQTEE